MNPEKLRQEHNAAIANGLILRARRIARVLDAIERRFANPCLYCGLDEREIPYEDTDAHRNTSEHQWTQYNA